MKYPKLRELKEAIKALVKGPYTSKFPYQPHKPYERFRGRPEFHQDDCIGCTACAQVCPSRAIDFQDKIANEKGKRVLTIQWDLCIFCGQCQANCPTEKGIILSQEFDLATTRKGEELKETIEKDLVLCEGCGEVIAPCHQILWVARKIGPLVFSNASLMVSYLRNSNLSLSAEGGPAYGGKEKISPQKEQEFLRSDRLKFLCPRCRREAVLKS